MKKLVSFIVIILMVSFIFQSCQEESESKGTLRLSITDAPIDMNTVSGVYLTITEIQIHKSGNDWMTFEEFEGPKQFNILELQEGNSELMGSFTLDEGNYTQLRFILDAPELSGGNSTNPGCYIKFNDETEVPLFVPSGAQTGWKAIGAFRVPANGEISVTADFDARKSVLKRPNGNYILRPVIRLIVDNQAGQISGSINNLPEEGEIIVYAYEDGIYDISEADDPVNEESSRFPNAITSDDVNEEGNYRLAFLAPMTYDLVVVKTLEGEFVEVLGIVEDVVVESRKATGVNIDLKDI